MSLMKEFREFISRGNVVDMAVGVIVGGAFSTIVNSLVNDIIMPVISIATGKIDFSSMFIALNGEHYASLNAAKDAGAAVFAYGSFIQNVIQFLLGHQGNQQGSRYLRETEAGRGSNHEDLSVLQERDSGRCNQMPALHLRASEGILNINPEYRSGGQSTGPEISSSRTDRRFLFHVPTSI